MFFLSRGRCSRQTLARVDASSEPLVTSATFRSSSCNLLFSARSSCSSSLPGYLAVAAGNNFLLVDDKSISVVLRTGANSTANETHICPAVMLPDICLFVVIYHT